MLRVVLDGHVQACIEGTTNFSTGSKSADNPLPRLGVLSQDWLRQPIWLLMDVDGLTIGILRPHPLAWAPDHVVALHRVLAEAELGAVPTGGTLLANQADLDGRGAL